MSFNGSGVFSISTSGQPVVDGTVISATVFNAFTADIATGLSTCMLKDGTQTATAGIGFFAGTVSLPGIYFGTDTATGFYRIGLNNNGYAVNGTKLMDLSAALLAITGAMTATTTVTIAGRTVLGTAAVYDNIASGNDVGVIFSNGGVLPADGTGVSVDNLKTLGTATRRWSNIHATLASLGTTTVTGTITVSGAFGCNTKTAQTAFASGGALNAYGAGANGLDSGANMSSMHALVVAIRAALVANGIMS